MVIKSTIKLPETLREKTIMMKKLKKLKEIDNYVGWVFSLRKVCDTSILNKGISNLLVLSLVISIATMCCVYIVSIINKHIQAINE